MEKQLKILTLGGLQLELGGKPIAGLPSRKAAALLVYLAVTQRPQAREHLASLLWDNQTQARALANLSVLLSGLRKQLDPFLAISRQTIGILLEEDYWVDAVEIMALLGTEAAEGEATEQSSVVEAQTIEAVLALYQGDFLAGFHLRNSRGYEEWILLEQEHIRQRVTARLETAVTRVLHAGDTRNGVRWARALVAIDPLREETHRQLMRLYARQAQWTQALAQYEACEELLAAELGVAPTPETRSLYDRIRFAMSSTRHNLPIQPAPFIGRETELGRVGRLLANPDCRLLTILGPGGIGKTRLALQAGDLQADRFLNGVYFVPLAAVASPDLIIPSIIRALDLQIQSSEDETRQLLEFLREKEILLILDNFEHLLSGSNLLSQLVREARDLKLLVTSRERLNLREEWVDEVAGLPFPKAADAAAGSIEPFGSVQLFIQKARQVKADFAAGEADLAAIARICQLVEGMPLAIELAAAWVRLLPSRSIAEELQGNLDFLSSQSRTEPGRHGHMRAVFDHSWNLLIEEEQQIFKKLSVFRGGFDRRAAREIAGASLYHLSSLADKSLIRTVPPVSPAGSPRYDLHELIRQYAEIMLGQTPEQVGPTRSLHCDYFSGWLDDLEARLWSGNQNDTFNTIDENLENIRAAWQYAIREERIEALDGALTTLFEFYLVRGRFQEGETALGQAIEKLQGKLAKGAAAPDATSRTLARLQVRQGLLLTQLAQFEQAEQSINLGLKTLRKLDTRAEEAFALNGLGLVYRVLGKYGEARTYASASLEAYMQIEDVKGIAAACNTLGSIAYRMSEYPAAKEQYGRGLDLRRELGDQKGMARAMLNLGSTHYRLGEYQPAALLLNEAIAMCRSLDDPWGLAASLNNLGNVQEKLGQYEEALQLYEDSLAIKREIGHRKGVASTLYNIGKVAYSLQNYHRAKDLFLDSVTQLRELGEKWSLANGLAGLGRAHLALGAAAESGRNYRESLQIARDIDAMILIEQAVAGLAEVAVEQQETPRAYTLAAFLLRRPPRAKEVQVRVEELLQKMEPALTSQEMKQAAQKSGQLEMAAVITALLEKD